LTIPLESRGKIKKNDAGKIAEAFHGLHERMFSYCVRESAVDLFHWRITALGKLPDREARIFKRTRKPVTGAQKGTRPVYSSDAGKFQKTKIYDGDRLEYGMAIEGPAVIEQKNMTIVVLRKQRLKVNRYGDFILAIN